MEEHRIIPILKKLAERGWTTLRSVGLLLGYKQATTIYGQQRGKNPIQTIEVGNTLRVYEEEVLRVLERNAESQVYLRLYRKIKNHV